LAFMWLKEQKNSHISSFCNSVCPSVCSSVRHKSYLVCNSYMPEWNLK